MQRRDQASGVPLEILEHLPPVNQLCSNIVLFSQLLCDNTDIYIYIYIYIYIIASCGISPAIQFYNYCFMHF